MNKLIELFRPHAFNQFEMDIEVAKILGCNVIKRQELLKQLTGQDYPLSHCTLSMVSNALQNYFKQPQLF